MAESENRTILNRGYFDFLCSSKTTLSESTFTEYGKAPRANRGYGPRRNLETVQAPTCMLPPSRRSLLLHVRPAAFLGASTQAPEAAALGGEYCPSLAEQIS